MIEIWWHELPGRIKSNVSRACSTQRIVSFKPLMLFLKNNKYITEFGSVNDALYKLEFTEEQYLTFLLKFQ